VITHVAVIRGGKTYSLPSPNRHHHVLYSGLMDKRIPEEADIQGFLDDTGKFLTRKEAYVVAKENGQLDRSKHPPGHYDGDDLFSEDVW
jgi:hypothetical protein